MPLYGSNRSRDTGQGTTQHRSLALSVVSYLPIRPQTTNDDDDDAAVAPLYVCMYVVPFQPVRSYCCKWGILITNKRWTLVLFKYLLSLAQKSKRNRNAIAFISSARKSTSIILKCSHPVLLLHSGSVRHSLHGTNGPSRIIGSNDT